MLRRDDLESLISTHKRHLQKLKEQHAHFGLHSPPHILIEIENIEAELEELQLELSHLDQTVSSVTLPIKIEEMHFLQGDTESECAIEILIVNLCTRQNLGYSIPIRNEISSDYVKRFS